MASVRRHLASLGLAVVLCHVVMQVLVPAALCCQEPLTASGTRAAARECCPEGSHPGKICPMHGSRAAQQKKSTDADCAVQPLVDLHDLLMMLSAGGVVPTLVELARPAGSESAPATVLPAVSLVSPVPLGPPPRA
jgi:hypothetical protein